MLTQIQSAYSNQRYETARRLCHSALKSPVGVVERNAILRLLHDTYKILGDFPSARAAIEQVQPTSPQESLDVALTLASDLSRLSDWAYFRQSAEDKAGFSIDEYTEKYTRLAREQFQKALGLATTPEQFAAAAAAIKAARYPDLLAGLNLPPETAPTAPPAPLAPPTGSLSGVIRFPDATPVAHATVVLGLPVEFESPDLRTYFSSDMDKRPRIGEQRSISTTTSAAGEFHFPSVPAAVHPFLALVLSPESYDISTRFIAHHVQVKPGGATHLDLNAAEWQSAPARAIHNPFASEKSKTLTRASVTYQRVHVEVLKNPFHYNFPRQPVHFKLPPGVPSTPNQLLLVSSSDTHPVPFQLAGDELFFFTDLPSLTDRTFALYFSPQSSAGSFAAIPDLVPVPEAADQTAIIDTGRTSFRIAWGAASATDSASIPPIVSVRGEDSVWRGQGRMTLPAGVHIRSRSTRVTQSGPLILSVSIEYALSNDTRYTLHLNFHRDEAYVLIHEICPGLDNASFEFSLKEFVGGRGFLHWTPEHGNIHWTTLNPEEREIARLQESVPWWIPPAGFGYAMTQDGLDSKDYIGVFTLHRGDWIDRKFQAISQGPGDEPAWRRELEWPYPEMVGSTVSMITGHTTSAGDAYFRFSLMDGERHWGLLVSTLERNDGQFKEISDVQHKISSPRLQDFKDWNLDETDSHARPHIVAKRTELRSLRAKKESPAFAKAWQLISTGKIPGPTTGVRFAIDGDPLVAWRKKLELVGVAGIRSKMTLLGRDFGDMYSPVGARPITQWAEDYDLIAASGAFTPEEERLVRTFLMLMAHMYMEPDFMNWQYGARNANFEADRVDVVGAIGLCFDGNPDSRKFVRHAVELMERSINVYCTPGSGKWYENPACYYFQALKCRMNLAFHLATHGLLDPTSIPRLKDFLRWGVLLLTPACPIEYDIMRDGTSETAYRDSNLVRRVAPIGDHANLGTAIPEHFALMAKLYRKTDPAFADLLLWAYQVCDSQGGHYSNLPLYYCALSEEDVAPAPAQTLASRRLEGFGSVFRGDFGKESEFFLLFKQGPAGYRYHRTEGSIILFADGKPLIYDGGEAGETWRHTTLSFHDVQLPMSAGHVERFHTFKALDFTQGVHPVIIAPGMPVYLNDKCDHELVDVCYKRFFEPNPAVVRSVIWVKNEYVILHDALNIDPSIVSHWHLQAVADTQTGDAKSGFIFKGRFGTDLQVLLPDQHFVEEKIERVPILDYQRKPQDSFAMQHLRLEAKSPRHYLGILRPLGKSRTPVTSQARTIDGVTIGVNVRGKGVNDDLFFHRGGTRFHGDGIMFTGSYGAILRRDQGMEMILIGAGELVAGKFRITSDGPAAHLSMNAEGTFLACDGPGTVVLFGSAKPIRVNLPSGRTQIDLSAML